MNFEGCRYYQRTLTRKYTMSVERENIVLNRKLSKVLRNQAKLFRDLQEAKSNVGALEFEVQNCHTTIKDLEGEVEDLHQKVYYLQTECDPENDPYEEVEKVEEVEVEEDLEPAENEVNEEPALDMSNSDYEKENEECNVSASGECECVKSVGVLEVADWTYEMPWSQIARY